MKGNAKLGKIQDLHIRAKHLSGIAVFFFFSKEEIQFDLTPRSYMGLDA